MNQVKEKRKGAGRGVEEKNMSQGAREKGHGWTLLASEAWEGEDASGRI